MHWNEATGNVLYRKHKGVLCTLYVTYVDVGWERSEPIV